MDYIILPQPVKKLYTHSIVVSETIIDTGRIGHALKTCYLLFISLYFSGWKESRDIHSCKLQEKL